MLKEIKEFHEQQLQQERESTQKREHELLRRIEVIEKREELLREAEREKNHLWLDSEAERAEQLAKYSAQVCTRWLSPMARQLLLRQLLIPIRGRESPGTTSGLTFQRGSRPSSSLLAPPSTGGGALYRCRITLQRLLDQSQAGPYVGESATYPPILGLFGPVRVPYPKRLNCLIDPL